MPVTLKNGGVLISTISLLSNTTTPTKQTNNGARPNQNHHLHLPIHFIPQNNATNMEKPIRVPLCSLDSVPLQVLYCPTPTPRPYRHVKVQGSFLNENGHGWPQTPPPNWSVTFTLCFSLVHYKMYEIKLKFFILVFTI